MVRLYSREGAEMQARQLSANFGDWRYVAVAEGKIGGRGQWLVLTEKEYNRVNCCPFVTRYLCGIEQIERGL